MLSSVQGFVSRRRRGLTVAVGVTGGIYLMGKYAKSKLIEFQEKGAADRTAKEKYAQGYISLPPIHHTFLLATCPFAWRPLFSLSPHTKLRFLFF